MKNKSCSEVVSILKTVICGLVDHEEAVKVSPVEGRTVCILEVEVHPEDVRRVIGRCGRTADALRDILHGLGGKVGTAFILEILEPARGAELPRPNGQHRATPESVRMIGPV